MRVLSSVPPPTANSGAAGSCRESPASNDRGNILPQAEWFALMARERWQFKVAAHLQHHLGYSERTCRSWGSAECEPPARALALLLRTEDGPFILEYIMRDSGAQWWNDLVKAKTALAHIKG